MKNYVEIRMYMPDETLRYLTTENLFLIDYEGVEEEGNFLIAYCEEEKYSEEVLMLMLDFPNETFIKQIIPAQNWNASWEKSFEPVVVDAFVAIRANFHSRIKDVQHEIIITPKMSFGTGHHATTFMMIQQMSKIDFKDKTVLDFGTGTGVLAILAKKSGAQKVVAIDNDEWSIENAKDNFNENNCSDIILTKSDFFNLEEKFDVILSNINKHIILLNLFKFHSALKAGGIILLSGLLADDENDILAETDKLKLVHINTKHSAQWISILLKN